MDEVVLGIDPGSRKMGFGVIQCKAGKQYFVGCGVVKMDTTATLSLRLNMIFEQVAELIKKYQPDVFAIESVFMSKNASSALKLGQARGAAIVAATQCALPVFEYEARKVKQIVTGSGAADKIQVQHMVTTLLKLSGTPREDAADALAIALCHSHHQKWLISQAGTGYRRGRVQGR